MSVLASADLIYLATKASRPDKSLPTLIKTSFVSILAKIFWRYQDFKWVISDWWI